MATYQLRTANPEDCERLREIHHAAFRETVSQIWGWDELLQDDMWNSSWPNPNMQVITQDGQTIGYLEMTRHEDHVFIANIALDPAVQARGVGTAVIRDILATADVEGLAVRLGVFKINHRARNLYQRLGLELTGETETHYQMEWRSTGALRSII